MAIDETVEATTTQPVGQQLKQARERKGLSDADIAQAQHLRPAIIQAIEAGDYSQVDSELFLKGYVRAYAKQVGLDDNAVIAELDRELEPLRQQREQEVQANPLVDIERRRRRKRQIARAVMLLAVAALAGYLILAYLMPEQELPVLEGAEPPAVENQAEAPDEEMEPAESPALESEPESSSASAMAEADVQDVEAQSGAVAESAPEPAVEIEQAPPASVTAEEDAVSETGSAPDTAAVTPAAEAPIEQASVQPEPTPAIATEAGRLQISFGDDCWVQVSDGAGNRLVNSLQRSGDQIDVTGEEPLRVVIGAVSAVDSIRYQGEPVNMGGFRVVNNRTEFALSN